MIRGRLIYRFLAELRRRSFGGAAFADPDFKEPRLIDADDDGLDDRPMFELPPINVPCQVEPKAFDELSMLASGNSPRSSFELIFQSSWKYSFQVLCLRSWRSDPMPRTASPGIPSRKSAKLSPVKVPENPNWPRRVPQDFMSLICLKLSSPPIPMRWLPRT